MTQHERVQFACSPDSQFVITSASGLRLPLTEASTPGCGRPPRRRTDRDARRVVHQSHHDGRRAEFHRGTSRPNRNGHQPAVRRPIQQLPPASAPSRIAPPPLDTNRRVAASGKLCTYTSSRPDSFDVNANHRAIGRELRVALRERGLQERRRLARSRHGEQPDVIGGVRVACRCRPGAFRRATSRSGMCERLISRDPAPRRLRGRSSIRRSPPFNAVNATC